MRKRTGLFLAVLGVAWAWAVPGAEITVFAAASLTDVLKQVAVAYQKHSTDKILFNFAATSMLARQIEEGAPADIFFSADEATMNGLDKKGLIFKDTRKSRLSNLLAIVVANEAGAVINGPQELATEKVKRLALADPKAVPAGIYAEQYLRKQKLWAAVEPKIIPTENVRGALAAVEAGNADAAIVYKTDAAISKHVKVACMIPAKDGPEISYPMAVLRGTKQGEAARKFQQFLASEEAGKIFKLFEFGLRD